MKLVCDGRRLSGAVRDNLVVAVEQAELSQLMIAQGYRLCPLRAPRGLRNGDAVIRLTWAKKEANATKTVRCTVRLHAPK